MAAELTDDQIKRIKDLWARDITARQISDMYPNLPEQEVLDLCIKLNEEFDHWCLMESKKQTRNG